MRRDRLDFLRSWLKTREGKPLVVRGARQVGKTWIVRHFAELEKLNLVELNFEKRPNLASFFDSNNPKQILKNIGAAQGFHIDPKNSLLFLDEIQACPELFAKLRWFAEDLPELPVIAAGSLLEFVLADHTFSMPVGRIHYMYLEPLSFEEFLLACHEETLLGFIRSFRLCETIPVALHEQLMVLFKEYLVIGGLPAVVRSWRDNHDFEKVNQLHFDLLTTYRDDFAKYSRRIPKERLDEVIMMVPKLLGEKFVYSKVNSDVSSTTIRQSLDLLCQAKVCHSAISCAANGVPLSAELNPKFVKVLLLDCGLCSAALGFALHHMNSVSEIAHINRGGIAEQVAGQILRTVFPPYIEPALYYWHRTKKGAQAEVDYVIQHHSQVVPIEVKAGSTGGLKSLHQFMEAKKLTLALRVNSDTPSNTLVKVKNSLGNQVEYHLLSLPFYLLGQVHRLIEDFNP